MIVPDINLLLYASRRQSAEHEGARKWWDSALNGRETVALAHVVVFGFIRICTNRRLFDPALQVGDAIVHVEGWLARPQVELLAPGPRHLEIAFGLLRGIGGGAKLTTDAHLAALAIENQAELHSHDGDFARFPGLRWIDPLA